MTIKDSDTTIVSINQNMAADSKAIDEFRYNYCFY